MSSVINDKKNRIIYFDYLRIFAVLAVIVIHVAAVNWYSIYVKSFNWNVLNFYHGITLWSVPIFVMISGCLFLNKNDSIKKIYKNNIFRIVTVFLFWTIFYGVYNVLFLGVDRITYITNLFEGYYHMWFLFMIVGLYMIVPFLKKIVESSSLTKYFLILSLIFAFVLPQMVSLIDLFSENVSLIINNILKNTSLYFVLGYSGYFICGYYLNKIDINKKWRIIIYILGIIGFISSVLLTALISIWQRKAMSIFYDYLTVNILLESVAVFVFAKYHLNIVFKKEKINMMISRTSKYTFGIYLVHPFIISVIYYFLNLFGIVLKPIISVPIITIIVFIISYIISVLLNNIPFLKKYIV